MKTLASMGVVHAAIERLQRLAHLFHQRRAELARRVGLSELQWRVLEEISTEHFIPSLFARGQQSSPAAVSRTLRQLIDKGLVEASIASDDGRKRRYELTEAGREVMNELRAHRERAIDTVWTHLDPQQMRAFTAFADQLIERLETYSQREE